MYLCNLFIHQVRHTFQVQRKQGFFRDDTALNGVKLGCSFEDKAGHGGVITSYESPWGQWTNEQSCGYRGGNFMFIRGFSMRVAKWMGPRGDDTAANNLIFICGHRGSHYTEEKKGNGMHWGSYGVNSGICPSGSAVCGIQVRAEKPQWLLGDDTALNDLKLFCCNH